MIYLKMKKKETLKMNHRRQMKYLRELGQLRPLRGQDSYRRKRSLIRKRRRTLLKQQKETRVWTIARKRKRPRMLVWRLHNILKRCCLLQSRVYSATIQGRLTRDW